MDGARSALARRVQRGPGMNGAWIGAGLGGLMIGGSALLLLAMTGRIAGVSGIVGGLASAAVGDRGWRIAFVSGLLLGGLLLWWLAPATLPGPTGPWPLVAAAGLLVGFGGGAANGCTSGHGVCGLGRRSRRSLVAVLVFMATGIFAAQVVRPLLGVAS